MIPRMEVRVMSSLEMSLQTIVKRKRCLLQSRYGHHLEADQIFNSDE